MASKDTTVIALQPGTALILPSMWFCVPRCPQPLRLPGQRLLQPPLVLRRHVPHGEFVVDKGIFDGKVAAFFSVYRDLVPSSERVESLAASALGPEARCPETCVREMAQEHTVR